MLDRQLQEVTRPRARTAQKQEQWFDVEDEEGVWRVGFCQKVENKFKVISLDGYHPCYTAFYCQHSGKVAPIRSKSKGLTVADDKKTIRKLITRKQIERTVGKLTLYSMKKNLIQNTPENITVFFRTQLLILVDKIFSTPYEIISSIKLIELHIHKLNFCIIDFYFKLIDNSKKFISQIEGNQAANQLFKAIYEITIMIELMMGVHKRSKEFFQSPLNRTLTSKGFLDYFLKEEGILPIRIFLKTSTSIKNMTIEHVEVYVQLISFFISLCEKYQSQILDGKIQSTTKLVFEEIINFIKFVANKNQEMSKLLKDNIILISRLETIYLRLFPNKECPIRKVLDQERDKERQKERQLEMERILIEKKQAKRSKDRSLNEKEQQRIKQLQERIITLESKLPKISSISFLQKAPNNKNQEEPVQPTENLGQEAFLSSLEWCLEAGDIEACKKMVVWRKSLLKLGRITGWEIALSVGMRTFRKKQINSEDIIEANYQYISKYGLKN